MKWSQWSEIRENSKSGGVSPSLEAMYSNEHHKPTRKNNQLYKEQS